MGKKTITITLGASSIDRAIKELNTRKTRLVKKCDKLRQRIAEELAVEAQRGFASAVVDDLMKGGGHAPDVTVSVQERGNMTVVIAGGKDAIWCEFGSGVYHNTPVGTSPHPKGKEFGFTIGSYGLGRGSRKAWGFYEGGDLKLTHGTQAQMPMYKAVQALCERVEQIVKEVFGRD